MCILLIGGPRRRRIYYLYFQNIAVISNLSKLSIGEAHELDSSQNPVPFAKLVSFVTCCYQRVHKVVKCLILLRNLLHSLEQTHLCEASWVLYDCVYSRKEFNEVINLLQIIDSLVTNKASHYKSCDFLFHLISENVGKDRRTSACKFYAFL